MTKKQDYQALNTRLDEVLAALQSPEVSIDEAIALHKEGTELVKALQSYLEDAKVTIAKINSSVK
jgi:exodeoxyribonuclease VII small subunit